MDRLVGHFYGQIGGPFLRTDWRAIFTDRLVHHFYRQFSGPYLWTDSWANL